MGFDFKQQRGREESISLLHNNLELSLKSQLLFCLFFYLIILGCAGSLLLPRFSPFVARGSLFTAVHGLLLAVASPVAGTISRALRLQWSRSMGSLVAGL